MDGSRIQSLVNRGYALSAQRVGLPHTQFRPSGPGNPLAAANLLATLSAAFSVDNYRFGRPSDYGKPEHQALVDGSQLLVGDYLVGPAGTYFIAALDPLVPILAISCNTILNVRHPAAPASTGLVGYGGDVASAETVVMTGWPSSLLEGTKGEKPDSGLPGDARAAWYQVLMPAAVGVSILPYDILIDAAAHRYKVSSAELTSKGWRLTAMYAGS